MSNKDNTLGFMVDKICSINNKMFMAQEELYVVRRMSFDDFKNTYGSTEEGLKRLYDCFKKSCDLNVLRQNSISEFDESLVNTVQKVTSNSKQ
jgi:hypothetical protein